MQFVPFSHISSASRSRARSSVYGGSPSTSSSASAKGFSFDAVVSRAQFFFLDQFVLSAASNRVVAHAINTEEWTCKPKKVHCKKCMQESLFSITLKTNYDGY
jgi:hypothetical protein